MMKILNSISEKLTNSKFIPWRFRHQGGPLNTIFQRPLRQKRLASYIEGLTSTADSLTVIYGIRNRVDYKFWHSLNSIRAQTYPSQLLQVMVVDYGSNETDLLMIKELCREFDAELIETSVKGDWNRSHCLNIGIKRSTSKFILTTDTDIIFSENYIETLVSRLKIQPLSVLFSKCLDLPENMTAPLLDTFENKEKIAADELLQHTISRSNGSANAGINSSYTYFYKIIGGYDEYFKLWGSEDNDIKRRLEYLGLESSSIADKAYYIHQWHPKHDGVNNSPQLKKTIEDNHQYLLKDHRIFKNHNGWGEY
jgi:glycosyltransferase involved in cell wall biosynthesis